MLGIDWDMKNLNKISRARENISRDIGYIWDT